jgi:sulfite reductase (NADPH) flavoprotein alpha-component
MHVAVRLPDNAPFSPAQRAWLDGFLAGYLGASTRGSGVAAVSAATAAEPAEPFEADNDLPWHDPSLSLDECMAGAAGRAPVLQLMAAMAQLDCGQCGYACREYAEAIASGAETSLTRCVPGGKATSRMLKQLMRGAGGGPGSVPAMPAAAASAAGAAPAAPGADVVVRLRQAEMLHRRGADKDTRHVVVEADSDVAYQPGDSLGVAASNDPGLVAAIIARLAVSPETRAQCPDGVERPLIEALAQCCEIRRPSDQAIEVLASRAVNRDESRVLQAMAEGYPGAGPEDADLLDLLETFPSARPPLSELVSALDPLLPRLYSIASSPKTKPREIHLAVAVVRYRRRERERAGVASTYLSERVTPGGVLSVHVRRCDGFRLPAPDTPVIMIGPGTGIAPFRAFLEERRATGATGRNWLFFGNPKQATDFLFGDELFAYRNDGLLTRLDTAFSRDQPHKIYVQHRMLENAAALWAWLQDGAQLYVCGDAERMARDVDRGLAYIVAKEGGMDAAGAKAYLAGLAREGRYLRDVY